MVATPFLAISDAACTKSVCDKPDKGNGSGESGKNDVEHKLGEEEDAVGEHEDEGDDVVADEDEAEWEDDAARARSGMNFCDWGQELAPLRKSSFCSAQDAKS